MSNFIRNTATGIVAAVALTAGANEAKGGAIRSNGAANSLAMLSG